MSEPLGSKLVWFSSLYERLPLVGTIGRDVWWASADNLQTYLDKAMEEEMVKRRREGKWERVVRFHFRDPPDIKEGDQ